MVGENVDAPSVAVVVEADFEPRLPSAAAEVRHKNLDDPGMRGVQRAVEQCTLPAKHDIQRCTERLHDRVERGDLQCSGTATFQRRDSLAGAAGARCEIGLAPSALQPKRWNGSGQVRAHDPMIASGDYRPLTGRVRSAA